MRCARRRVVASVAGRSVGHRGGARGSRRSRGDRGRHSHRALAARRAARRSVSCTPRRSRGGGRARSSPRGTGDSRSSRHDAGPADPRWHRAVRARPPRPPGRRSRRSVVSGDVAPAHRRLRPDVVPAAARTTRRRRSSLPDLSRAVSLGHSARRDRARPRRAAPPRVVQPLDTHVLVHRGAARRPRGEAPHRRLRVHEARARRVALGARGPDRRRAERRRGRLHTRRTEGGRRLRARGRDARAAQEPRSHRPCGGRRVARRRRARLGRRRGACKRHVAPECDRRGARGALPGCALPRLRVPLRRFRHSGRRGARVRLPDRHVGRLADGGARRRRRDPRRSDRRRGDQGGDRPRRCPDAAARRGLECRRRLGRSPVYEVAVA